MKTVETPRAERSWKQHLTNFITALSLAVLIWIWAELESDPNETRTYPQPIPLEVRGQAEDLIVVNTLPSGVILTLRAPRSVWEERLQPEQLEAWIDLSGLDVGSHTVPVQVAVHARPVQVVDYRPREVTVVLSRLIQRTLPVYVEVVGEPAVGYEARRPQSWPPEVTITGPEEKVNQVQRVVARINIQGVRETVRQQVRLQALDEQGLVVSGVQLSPPSVLVTVPVERLGGFRDVVVRVVLEGQPAPGYRITNVAVHPPVVTVFAQDPTLVQNLSFVETEPILLDQATEPLERLVPLRLPEGVSVVGDDRVRVEIQIEPLETSLTLNLPVEVVGLAPGLQASIAPETVDVLLAGPVPVLENLDPRGSVRVVVDLKGRDVGTYTLEPQVEVLLDDVRVVSVLPVTVEVTIEPRSPVTPTPTATASP
ncbi:MAG: hypothetical protein GXO37_02915 [Chloroflexi bacterium]|nr:hypothetical protein [Chloroflexota bacterium]